MQREFPEIPLVGVGAIIIEDSRVLLVKRAHPPLQAQWSIPGGVLEVGELVREQALAFTAPKVNVAEINNEAVGVGITDEVDKHWIELRVAVFPAFRGRGYGAAIAGTLADELEAKEGRLVCAGIHQMDERSRLTMERGGFRLVDYYFLAERKLR